MPSSLLETNSLFRRTMSTLFDQPRMQTATGDLPTAGPTEGRALEGPGRSALLYGVNATIAVLTVLGNGLVIAVMLLRRRQFSSVTNRLILHQSVIDAVSGLGFFVFRVLLTVPGAAARVSTEGNPYDQLVCRLMSSGCILWGLTFTSTNNLVVISLERFAATCYPVAHRNALSRRTVATRAVITATWLVGFLVGMQGMFLFEPFRGECRLVPIPPAARFASNVSIIAIPFLVPVAVLTYAYARILAALKKLGGQGRGTGRPAMRKAKRNVLVTTLLVGAMFIVCWTPIEVLFIYSKVRDTAAVYSPLYPPLAALLACNMFINPIIYCFNYDRFRSHLRDLVLGQRGRNRVHGQMLDGDSISLITAQPQTRHA